tara:strand:+ start:959 stop:1477 length:519 start_codon:yes stop_codon:yes gene_type:complete
MGRFSERRALYYEDDETFNPILSVDVNEYLIQNYEATTLKQRRAIWSLCQNDEEFDYSSIEFQIDDWVLKYAVTDPNMNTSFKVDSNSDLEETDEEESDEIEDLIHVDIREYLDDSYENMPDNEADDLIYIIQSLVDWEPVYKQMEVMIDKYYNGDYEDFLNESDEEEQSED